MLNLSAKMRSARLRTINQLGRNRDAVFIWIPKAAGTSVYGALEQIGCPKIKTPERVRRLFPQRGLVTFGHQDYRQLREAGLVSDDFDARAKKFAICRNPYDRAVSLYFYIKDRHRLFAQWHSEPSFLEFLEQIERGHYERIGLYNERGMSQANPQVEWTRGIALDYVGRVENLSEAMQRIGELVGRDLASPQWLNKGSASEPSALLDSRARYLIDKIYDEDFATFGYEKKP